MRSCALLGSRFATEMRKTSVRDRSTFKLLGRQAVPIGRFRAVSGGFFTAWLSWRDVTWSRMTSVREHVRRSACSRVEYFRCQVRELIDEALTVDFVEDAARVVIPNNTHTYMSPSVSHVLSIRQVRYKANGYQLYLPHRNVTKKITKKTLNAKTVERRTSFYFLYTREINYINIIHVFIITIILYQCYWK